MKKIFLSALLLSLTGPAALASRDLEQWLSSPKLHEVPAQFAKESAVYVLERNIVEYYQEGNEVFTFTTLHRIIKVLDDRGIESFNTVTITNYGLEVRDIKARVILPGGKVVETPKDKIRETKTENNLQQYVFALESLEKGAEIELIYTIKFPFYLFGSEYFQASIPMLHTEFELRSPNRILFETKGYNGYPMAKDSTNTDTSAYFSKFYTCSMDNIPGLKEEDESNYYPNLRRIEYRAAYLPVTKPGQRQFTWDELARNIYTQNYTFSEKELNVVRKYLKSIGVGKEDPELDKIRKIEDETKKNINTSKDVGEENEGFEVLLSKKVTTENGLNRFFAACFTEAGVLHELGVTANRYQHLVDDKFENWKQLDYYLFYFPNQKSYMAPTISTTRTPYIAPQFLCNKAIFCKITTLGNTKTALASIRTISQPPAELSHNDINATISFKGEKMVPEVQSKVTFSGYSAAGLREAFLYTPKEHEKELVGNFTDIATGLEEIVSYSVEHTDLKDYYTNTPLTVSTVTNASKLMDKAGSKLLFKVGEVIGKQSEMYQTEERKLPIEMPFPHTLKRTLVVNIPENYKVANPEMLNRNIVHKTQQGKEISGFVSGYTLEGNKLTINILEYYSDMQIPVSEYAAHVKVINAAADFNKVVLIFEHL